MQSSTAFKRSQLLVNIFEIGFFSKPPFSIRFCPNKLNPVTINVIVIIVSGSIATFGYQVIPFKAYVIVAAAISLLIAFILTKFIKKK